MLVSNGWNVCTSTLALALQYGWEVESVYVEWVHSDYQVSMVALGMLQSYAEKATTPVTISLVTGGYGSSHEPVILSFFGLLSSVVEQKGPF